MKRIACFIVALLLLFSAAPFQAAAANTVFVPVEAEKLYSESFKMLEMVNRERTSRGLSALTMDAELLELAMTRAYETAIYWSHTRPIGSHYSSLSSRLNRENISCKTGGPIDRVSDTINVMNGLMESSAHRDNILNSQARSIGIGVISLGYHVYWVQSFCFSSATSTAAEQPDVTATKRVEVLRNSENYKPRFTADSTNLKVGDQTQLRVVWEDELFPFEGINVHSSNPNVASVSGSTVTANASGTTVLSIHYGGDHGGAQQITLTVTGGEAAKPYQPMAFKDVDPDSFYADPVGWAVNHDPQITAGTSAVTFSPLATCTRGQVVTFLWRAAGCPEPESTDNPFKDVKDSAYYCKAVLWAAENGITSGTSKTTFSPGDPCTRAHVVTFLWRAHEKPEAAGSNPFSDVKDGLYYTDAVLWAVSKNITQGTSATTFSPANPCTRGQIVTFLYRDMK